MGGIENLLSIFDFDENDRQTEMQINKRNRMHRSLYIV